MRRYLLILLVVLFVSGVFADDYIDSSVSISVDIVEPIAKVKIDPSSAYLGEITKGFKSNQINFTATNIGTLDFRIAPRLKVDANPIFEYLEFASASCSSWSNLTKWQSAIIDTSQNYGEDGEEYSFCMRLDLGDYEETIVKAETLYTDLVFYVMPA